MIGGSRPSDRADFAAAVKRGAEPSSPRLTADVSSTATQSAPIEIGLQARCGQRHEMQIAHAPPDQCPRGLHRHASDFARHRQHDPVMDGRQGVFDRLGYQRQGSYPAGARKQERLRNGLF
jgi:hypothetical protein